MNISYIKLTPQQVQAFVNSLKCCSWNRHCPH